MAQTEQDFVRDFCPKCTIKVPENAISCNNCGSEDLIPNPFNMAKDLVEASRDFEPPPVVWGDKIKEELIDYELDKAGILSPEEEDLIIGAIPLQALPTEGYE